MYLEKEKFKSFYLFMKSIDNYANQKLKLFLWHAQKDHNNMAIGEGNYTSLFFKKYFWCEYSNYEKE
jgi:hypothetical protein